MMHRQLVYYRAGVTDVWLNTLQHLHLFQGNVLYGWLIINHISDSSDKFLQDHLNTFANMLVRDDGQSRLVLISHFVIHT